jgi:hypothetical protein
VSGWIELATTTVIAVVGLYLANGYRRQSRVRLAEARRSAYAQLWEKTMLAAPTRLEGAEGALRLEERTRLHQDLTNWYYRNGNGMLLDNRTRRIYLDAKHNLTCLSSNTRPDGVLQLLPVRLSEEAKRGCLSMRQLSLLRTQMKVDLAIFGDPYVRHLADHERLFLKNCGVSLYRKPWRKAARGEASQDECKGA